MPDRGVVVTEPGLAECPRCLQVEDVVLVAVANEPEVPDPLVGKSERHLRTGRHELKGARPGAPR